MRLGGTCNKNKSMLLQSSVNVHTKITNCLMSVQVRF